MTVFMSQTLTVQIKNEQTTKKPNYPKMCDKKRNFAAPATKPPLKSKRPPTVSLASASRTRIPQSAVKDRTASASRSKINKNATVLGDCDVTFNSQDMVAPESEDEYRQIAYGKFLRGILEYCLVNEKITREETEIDVQMAQLAMRFQNTIELMDKTNRRMKNVSFVVEQQRLLDLKNNDSTQFYQTVEKSDAHDLIKDLAEKEKSALDQLETKNVDFGYSKDSGHQQLLDALNDALIGLDDIKKHSKLDVNKLKEYENSQKNLDDIAKDRMDLESLKKEFESKFPKFGEKLLKETSEKIAKMMEDCEDDAENDDDDK